MAFKRFKVLQEIRTIIEPQLSGIVKSENGKPEHSKFEAREAIKSRRALTTKTSRLLFAPNCITVVIHAAMQITFLYVFYSENTSATQHFTSI